MLGGDDKLVPTSTAGNKQLIANKSLSAKPGKGEKFIFSIV